MLAKPQTSVRVIPVNMNTRNYFNLKDLHIRLLIHKFYITYTITYYIFLLIQRPDLFLP